MSTPDTGMDGATTDGGGDPTFVASCEYVNTFSDSAACREYRGAGWSAETTAADCEEVFFGAAGVLALGAPCDVPSSQGRCTVGDLDADGYVDIASGDPASCGQAQAACETFAGGTFDADPACNQCGASDEIGSPFVPPTRTCMPALEGEPPGASDGEVCTWNLISASTEPGRRYADYADCDIVRSQRPYYFEASPTVPDPEDPRLDDEAYLAEVAWIKDQAESSACSCCHTASETPEGAAIWDTEAGALWIDTVTDEALAMLAGYTDSAAFGFLDAGENNTFDRSATGLPTTDSARLLAFAERELERRGVTTAEAAELEPFAPFFRELIDFEPEACDEGIGVDDAGNLSWSGGGARYIHVLSADSLAPGVPPNWDMPEGTLWAIRVPPTSLAMSCGGAYGELPEGAIQEIPEAGEAPELVSGETYFLYVQSDIAQPITRCLFTAP